MKTDRFTKIGADGQPVSADAKKWEAVLDNRTGLMWSLEHKAVENYGEVDAAATSIKAAGFNDWRLPTVDELFMLADRTRGRPAIDTGFFPRTALDWYWSSTPYAPSPGDCAWGVNFDYGDANWLNRNYDGFVRAVRAGQS